MSKQWAQFEDPAEASGYAQISNALLRHPGISLQAKGFYALLKSYAWQDPSTFPGVKRLCADTGASDNTLKKYREELITVGLLDVKRQGQGRPNLYIFKSLNEFLKGGTENPESHTGAKQESHTGASLEPNTGANYEDAVDEDAVDNSPEGAAKAATEEKEKPTNYMTLFADMAKNLGYEMTPEDKDELPKNFKLTAAKTDDATMRKVVWKVLDARANRNYSLSPQKALQELTGNVSDIGSRSKPEKGVAFDADGTPRYNGKKITFTDDGWEKQLWVGDMEDVGRWPEVLAAFRERGMEPEYKKIGSYWNSKGSA